MGMLSRAIERRSASYSLQDPALSALFGGGITNAAGKNVTPDTALRTSAVYCCVTVLAETLASFPKDIKRYRADGGLDIDRSHRCHSLLHDRPNSWQSSFEFFEMMEGHRLLRGNAYGKIIYNPGRKLNEVVPMHPDTVFPFVITPNKTTHYLFDNSPCPPAGSTLWYQHMTQEGQEEILSAKEVLHIRNYSINGIVGLSPIKWAAYQAVGLAMATEEHGARLFSNGAQIGTVLRHPAKISAEANERLKKSYNENHVGVGKAHKTILLEEGMDISKIGMTAEESQFLETRKFQIEDIFRIYKVPLMLGASGDKAPTFASAEQFLTLFKTVTMHAIVKRWEGALERDLLYGSEIGKVTIDFDMDSLVRGDIKSRGEYLQKMFGMAAFSPDDVRMFEGKNPTGTEEGKQYYLQSGMMPAKMAGQKPIAPKGEKI